MHSLHPNRKTPAQTLCQATIQKERPHDRAAQPSEPIAICLQAQRDELGRRILAGELDDAPLYISQPAGQSPPQRCCSSRLPPPARGITHSGFTHQDELALAELRQDFPGYRLWLEPGRNQRRFVARRLHPGTGPYAVVTSDPAELRAALTQPGRPRTGKRR
jgi:hypothetical protein